MTLHSMGIGYKHDRNFRISRPNGSGDNLLLIFKTPAFITVNGTEITVVKDTAVLYSKKTPQFYGAADSEYENHWVHFDCNENDIFFDRSGAVFNRPTPVISVSSAENLLEMLRVESVSGGERRNECVNLLLRLLIAKAVGADERSLKSPHSEQLRELRAQIYSNPAKKFSIDELSKQISLSPTYFQTLYKSEFDVSCYEDILRAKTELAEYYLKSTNLSVCRISELCGYENDVHFMRQFHRRKGMTALKFREYNK